MSKEAKPKGGAADEDDDAKVERKATTMYLQPAILADFKKRIVDEPGYGYEVVEEMIKGFLQFSPEVTAALWQVKERQKKGLYKAVEEAIVRYLEKAK
jgi:hypothetical protein